MTCGYIKVKHECLLDIIFHPAPTYGFISDQPDWTSSVPLLYMMSLIDYMVPNLL